MAEEPTPLVRLDATDLTLADESEDVRGRTLVDRDGDEVGEIDGLLIDQEERRVRLLQVGSGGFLGIGRKKVFVPAEAVTAIDDAVHIDKDRAHVAAGPVYDPELTPDRDNLVDLYKYHGFAPFWTVADPNPNPAHEYDPIAGVDVGMRVLDSDDEQVGTVSALKMGDPEATTTEGQRPSPGLVGGVVGSFVGSEPDVPEQHAEQLLREGYIKIDAKGVLARDLYARADDIAGVDETGVRLTVPRARLIPKDRAR